MKTYRSILSLVNHLLFIVLVIPSLGNAELTKDTYRLAITRKLDSVEGMLLLQAYTEAFRRLNKKVELVFLPEARANHYLKHADIDGDVARVAKFADYFPNLIRIEEPLRKIEYAAYVKYLQVQVKNWESLGEYELRVEFMRGSKFREEKLQAFIDPERLTQVNHWTQGLKRLEVGRIDVFVEVKRTIDQALLSEKFRESGIVSAGVLEQIAIHGFLQRHHSSLAEQLSATFREMKRDGTIDEIEMKVMTKVRERRSRTQ